MKQPLTKSKRSPAQLSQELQKLTQEELAAVQPDDLPSQAEKQSLEDDKLEIENERLRNELAQARDLHDIRKTYTRKLFWLIVGWLSVVVIYVGLTATVKTSFNLSDNVLIAFITSTTVSVLGLFVLVAKWLFPANAKDENGFKKGRK